MTDSNQSPDKKTTFLKLGKDSSVSSVESGDDSERRRVPRLLLASEQFRLKQNGKIFSVVDLSADGMAIRILDNTDLTLFPVGMRFEGSLNLHRTKFEIRAQVMHVGQDLIGCRFEGVADDVKQALLRLFDPEVMGKDLKPIPASEGSSLWYHGTSGTDLLFWRKSDGQYHRLTLYVLGQWIQWDEEEGLRTGQCEHSFETSEIRGVLRFETMIVEPDQSPDLQKLSIAKRVILSSNLPQDLKRWATRQLQVQ